MHTRTRPTVTFVFVLNSERLVRSRTLRFVSLTLNPQKGNESLFSVSARIFFVPFLRNFFLLFFLVTVSFVRVPSVWDGPQPGSFRPVLAPCVRGDSSGSVLVFFPRRANFRFHKISPLSLSSRLPPFFRLSFGVPYSEFFPTIGLFPSRPSDHPRPPAWTLVSHGLFLFDFVRI